VAFVEREDLETEDPMTEPTTIVLADTVPRPAPDGSDIRTLPTMNGGGLCHCTLESGKTSMAVHHRNVEEIWYVLSGSGEIWRKLADKEEVTLLLAGVSLAIPPQTHFQFRTTSSEPLRILIATIPPWPGPEQAVLVSGHW
jgi:mannose-6-phosphate isomerase-like protein (cupin superfamily)